MKIKPEHYQRLKKILEPYIDETTTTTRARWDALWTALPSDPNVCREMYGYMNDENIDTALRRIIYEWRNYEARE